MAAGRSVLVCICSCTFYVRWAIGNQVAEQNVFSLFSSFLSTVVRPTGHKATPYQQPTLASGKIWSFKYVYVFTNSTDYNKGCQEKMKLEGTFVPCRTTANSFSTRPRRALHTCRQCQHSAQGKHSHEHPAPCSPAPALLLTFTLVHSHQVDMSLIWISIQTDYDILTWLPLNAAELRHQGNKWTDTLMVIDLPVPQQTNFHVEVILSLDITAIRNQLNIN